MLVCSADCCNPVDHGGTISLFARSPSPLVSSYCSLRSNTLVIFHTSILFPRIGVGGPSDLGGGGGDLLTRKKCAMPECVSVEIKTFTIQLTSNETVIIPKIVVLKTSHTL